MNRGLVPELRQDRNGNFVTRWVKPGRPGRAAGAHPVPGPGCAQPTGQRVTRRRGGTSRYDRSRASTIRLLLRVPDSAATTEPIEISDDRVVEFMQLGYSINEATEFSRWGATPAMAAKAPMGRSRAREAVVRMRALGLTPEEIARLVRHGLTDEHLCAALTDEDLHEIFRDQSISVGYRREVGLSYLVRGSCTREDYLVLGLAWIGQNGYTLTRSRAAGIHTPVQVLKRITQRMVDPALHNVDYSLSQHGWDFVGQWLGLRDWEEAYQLHGEAVLTAAYPGLFRVKDNPYGAETAACAFADRFLSLREGTPLRVTMDQCRDSRLRTEGPLSGTLPGFVELLRREGLTPEQALDAVVAGLTSEQAREIHLGGQAAALIDGWL